MEAYDGGQVLKYDAGHVEDEFGGLSEKPLDLAEFQPYLLTREVFEAEWCRLRAWNRSGTAS